VRGGLVRQRNRCGGCTGFRCACRFRGDTGGIWRNGCGCQGKSAIGCHDGVRCGRGLCRINGSCCVNGINGVSGFNDRCLRAGRRVRPRAAHAARACQTHATTGRLRVPLADQRAYGQRLQAALDAKDLGALAGEYVILVDRSANVQALFIYFRAMPGETWQMIGASPVATGRPGEFDHFLTPLGVFEHTPSNMDFRAEGTMNENNIRGYGKRDMRIYDFGWVDGERGWGKGGYSPMRFQMHATDPDRLEPLLGIRHSKGCVRIPASLNAFIDHNGIIDAEYQALVDSGKSLWVLHPNREITPWAGRFIVVIDSARKTRPAWAPAPGSQARAKLPKGGDTAD
jgi:hypothetical protein